MSKLRSDYLPLSQISLSIVFLLVLSLTYLVYSSGFNGPFLFDDAPNLSALSAFGGVSDFASALYFVFSNESGPLGRPVSMATFLLNDQTWPSDPYSFKYTNAMLHLLNGCLVFYLLMQLGKKVSSAQNVYYWLALVATAVWLIHPFNISTVLYVVQRMTILSTMGVLLSLNVYLYYRSKFNDVSILRQILILSQIGFFCALGLLSKETASLLVIYIAAFEITIFSGQKSWRFFRSVIFLGCCMFTLAVLLQATVFGSEAWQNRDYTMYERVLTQSRIIWDYFFHIVIPRSGGTGLMHDDYLISKSLLQPWTTIVSLVGLLLVVAVSLIRRKSAAVIALCILWFLGGHLLESTIIPLENYFEHRNYLPMVMILWGGAYGIYKVSGYLDLKLFFSLVYLCLTAAVTYSNIQIWGDEALLNNMWGVENQSSPRAQQMLTRQAIERGDFKKATSIVNDALLKSPNSHHLIIQQILLQCVQGKEIDVSKLQQRFQGGVRNMGVFSGLEKLRGLLSDKKCSFLTPKNLLHLNSIFLKHESYQGADSLAFIYNEMASLYVIEGDLNNAILSLDEAYRADNSVITIPINQALWLYSAGLEEEAFRYLDIAKNTKPKNYMQSFQYKKIYEATKKTITKNN